MSEVVPVVGGAGAGGEKFYKVEMNKTEWTLPHKYKNPLPIGSGAYGQVW